MTNFILQKRVCWTDAEPASLESGSPAFLRVKDSAPFAHPDDYRILVNDWPYGLARGITHICVWLKVRLPVDDVQGDLTPEGRALVDEFVNATFVDSFGVRGKDQVIWFKNWTGLQSVRGLEHVHVLVRDIPQEALDRVVERPWENEKLGTTE